MDPTATFPNMYHPASSRLNRNFEGFAKYYTRTARPTKYYLIDFGLSRKYNPEDGEPQDFPIRGGDKSVPEFQGNGVCKRYNPFPTDIYYLGNMIRQYFLLVCPLCYVAFRFDAICHQTTKGVEFMQPLVDDMIQDDPHKRPTIDEVVARFDQLIPTLSTWTLRSRLIELEESEKWPICRVLRRVHHFFRTSAHILTFHNSIPRPRV